MKLEMLDIPFNARSLTEDGSNSNDRLEVNTRKDEWTIPYLVDELKGYLSTVNNSKSRIKTDLLDTPNDKFNTYFCPISNRHYVNQAFHYLKIGVIRSVPEFLISLSDLSPKLVKELAVLDKKEREFVVKQAVERIFEDINPRLYHNSISKVLKVGFVD